MSEIVTWATNHARMIVAFVILSLSAGLYAYTSLPKEGEPDIEIPALFVSVPFPGISAEDSSMLYKWTLGFKKRPEMAGEDQYKNGWNEGFSFCRFSYSSSKAGGGFLGFR